MNTKNLGILLVIIGALMMIYTGFTYFTTQKVVDIGSLHIDKEKGHLVSWSPIIGGILLIIGLVVFSTRKKA